VAEGEKGVRSEPKKEKMLFNDERSRNVYENKQKDDNFTEEKGDISTHFSQNHTFFSETAGFFVTMGAFENEFRTSKCRNSRCRLEAGATLQTRTLPRGEVIAAWRR
jgi:hypothetical protein